MKNIRLIVGLLFICSCSPTVTNITPSSIPTKSPETTPTNIISPSTSPSSTPTPISVFSPNPKDNQAILSISSDDDKLIQRYNYNYSDRKLEYTENIYYQYNIALGETKLFRANIIYKGQNQDVKSSTDFDWTSSNNEIVSVSNGLIKAESQLGKATITATSKIDQNFKIYFDVNLLLSNTYEKDVFTYASNCRVLTKSSKTLPIERYLEFSHSSSDSYQAATFNGKVYDTNNQPVQGAIVNAKAFDGGWVGQSQVTIDGAYVFRNAPKNANIEITVTKDGWTTRQRTEILKSNLSGDPCANFFNFEGIKAIQDEPEINELKINDRVVYKSSIFDVYLPDTNSAKNVKPTIDQLSNISQIENVGNTPSLTTVKADDLKVEMTFSEPVRRDDIESYFRITSQSNFDNRIDSFVIDKNYLGTTFDWSADDKSVVFKTNKAILANRGTDEARYLIDFSQAFRDKTDRSAIDKRYFRFSNDLINDFAVFSVKNDEEAPKLLGISAKDGEINDTIELRYSESMEGIGYTNYPVILTDPVLPLDASRKFLSKEANSINFGKIAVKDENDNNATLLGYMDSKDNRFKTVYMVGRILDQSNPRVEMLGISLNPAKSKLKNAKINKNVVTLEFEKDSFEKRDIVIVSVLDRITGSYVDRNRTPSINKDISVEKNPLIEYHQITDPSGRMVDGGNNGVSGRIDVNNRQRFSIVQ